VQVNRTRPHVALPPQGYAAEHVRFYIDETVGSDSLCVGEYWTDMAWAGKVLNRDQNAARQKLCDYIDACGRRLRMFDFPTKGILQVRETSVPCDLAQWQPAHSHLRRRR